MTILIHSRVLALPITCAMFVALLLLLVLGCGSAVDVNHRHDKQEVDVKIKSDPKRVDVYIHRDRKRQARQACPDCPCGPDCECGSGCNCGK